jgi:hypothetical protein
MSTYYDLIKRTYEQKNVRGWKTLFWCIDLHDVIIEGTYSKFNEGRKLAPYAGRVLRFLTGEADGLRREDSGLILWTSSHEEPVADILKWLESEGIKFDYVNENPECPNTELCDFERKFYFNILLDDKAGFNWKTDWAEIDRALKEVHPDYPV